MQQCFVYNVYYIKWYFSVQDYKVEIKEVKQIIEIDER